MLSRRPGRQPEAVPEMHPELMRFGTFEVDLAAEELRKAGIKLKLQEQPFHVLAALLRQPQQIVTREELRKQLWPADTFVDFDQGLNRAVAKLREVLGDLAENPRFIETLSRRGYRFIAPVEGTTNIPRANIIEEKEDVRHRRLLLGLSGTLIAAALIAAITIGWTRIHRSETQPSTLALQVNVQARDAYLRGRHFWNQRTQAGYKRAIEYFEESIRQDPHYAPAYAGLADSYTLLAVFGLEPVRETQRKARAAALRAIEINERSAEGHASMAYIMSRFDSNWLESEQEFRRAIELDPSYATAHHWYSLFLVSMGRTDDAIAEIRQAQNLDPASLVINTDAGLIFFYARQYDRTIQECKKVLEKDPNFALARRTLGLAYAQKGMYREAIVELKEVRKSLPDLWTLAETGRVYALAGEKTQALRVLRELHQQSRGEPGASLAVALACVDLQEKREEAFYWLNRAYEANIDFAILSVSPQFDSIRHDPRFEDLLKRAGVPSTSTARAK